MPANAFVDADGNVITEPVTLSCREIKSAADIVVSGIPMTFTDENGEEQQFKSAGMFDIRGTAGGKEIFIAEDKSIKVNFASTVQGEYDLFYLEEESVKPETAGTIPAAMAQAPAASLSQARWIRLTDEAEKTPPASDLEGFTIQFDTAQYPEAKVLQQINWKIKKGETNNPLVAANKAILEEKWKQVSLSKPEKRINVIKSLPGLKLDAHNNTGHFLVKDSSGFTIFNAEGQKIKSVEGFSKAKFLNETTILFTDNAKNYKVTNLNGKELFKGTNEEVLVSEDGYFVSYRNWGFTTDVPSVSFRDKSGSLIQTYKINNYIIKSDKYICLMKEDGMFLYSYSGKMVKQLPKPVTASEILEGSYHILYTEWDKNDNIVPIVWDWKNDKTYRCPEVIANVYPSFDGRTEGLVIISSNNKTILWNYLKNTTRLFHSQADISDTHPLLLSELQKKWTES